MSGFHPLPSKPTDHKSSPTPADENRVQRLMPQFTWAKSKTNPSTYHTVFDTAENAHTFKSKLLQLIKQCGQPLDAVVDRTLKGAYVVSIMGVTEPVLGSLDKESQAQFKALSSEQVLPTEVQLRELITELNKGNLERCKEILGTITDFKTTYYIIIPLGIKTFSLALKENTTLTSLDLGGRSIRTAGVKELAKALQENTTLTSLNLECNSVGDEGATDLANALLKNTTLTLLNLGDNFIGPQGTTDLADALKENTTLTSLNLWRNYICDEGAKDLANALKENTTLISLDFGGSNSIGDAGTEDLANALKENTALTSLNLIGNNIGTAGAKKLANALKENTTLTSLKLASNNIGNAGMNHLADALNENAILTFLELAYNSIYQEMTLVTQSLTRNQAFHPKFGLLQCHLADKLHEFISMPTDLTKIIVAYAGGFNVAMVSSVMLSLVRQSFLQELSSKMATDVAKIVVEYTVETDFKILLGLLDEIVSRQILSKAPPPKSSVEIEVLSDKEDAKAKPSKYDYKNSKQKLSSNAERAAVSFATAQSFHQQAKPLSAASSAPSSSLSLGRG